MSLPQPTYLMGIFQLNVYKQVRKVRRPFGL